MYTPDLYYDGICIVMPRWGKHTYECGYRLGRKMMILRRKKWTMRFVTREEVGAKGPPGVGCWVITLYVTHVVLLDRPLLQHDCDVIVTKEHSVQQKSSGLIFRTSRSGSHVTYSCHHNSSRFSFPIFVNSWRFSVFHSLQSITPHIY